MKRWTTCVGLVLFLCGCRSPAPAAALLTPAISHTVPADAAGGPAAADPAPAGDPVPTADPIPTAEATAAPARSGFSIAFVGDIMLGRSLAERILRGDGGTIFAAVEPILRSADLSVGNLECAIGEGGVAAPKAYVFRAPAEAAGILQTAGFDLLSLANNHSLDYGAGVLEQTEQALRSAGISFLGAGADEERARAPVLLDLDGFRLAFLAYVDVPKEYYGFDPRVWAAEPDSPGVAWAEDEKVAADVRRLGSQADFVVVLFHFGDEGAGKPNRRQIELAHLAVDNGADLVVGSHPHILQAEEEYESRLIFYSLGNFVFDGFSGAANHSAVLWTTVYRGGEVEYSWMPVTIVGGVPLIGE